MEQRRYSLGHAFSTQDILYNFPYNKLLITCQECKQITGDMHRKALVSRIFKDSVRLVLDDIIDNNATFWLPLTGTVKCNIHMRRVRGEEFKNMRKGGKWSDVDILSSSFTGYELGMFMYGNRTPRRKTIYINKEYKDRITKNTNLGKSYGDSSNDKYIKDYYDIIFQKYPTVHKNDIKRILNFSWKSLYLHNSYGGDTLLIDNDLWMYIGMLQKDSLKHFLYYIKKLTVKLRVLYKRKNIEWDGYYYFALTDKQYNEYLAQKKERGRPRKYFTFNKIYLYQILDECKIQEHEKRYIFKVPFISQIKLKWYSEKLVTDKAELIISRDPLKFKDILVYNNNYEFI